MWGPKRLYSVSPKKKKKKSVSLFGGALYGSMTWERTLYISVCPSGGSVPLCMLAGMAVIICFCDQAMERSGSGSGAKC